MILFSDLDTVLPAGVNSVDAFAVGMSSVGALLPCICKKVELIS